MDIVLPIYNWDNPTVDYGFSLGYGSSATVAEYEDLIGTIINDTSILGTPKADQVAKLEAFNLGDVANADGSLISATHQVLWDNFRMTSTSHPNLWFLFMRQWQTSNPGSLYRERLCYPRLEESVELDDFTKDGHGVVPLPVAGVDSAVYGANMAFNWTAPNPVGQAATEVMPVYLELDGDELVLSNPKVFMTAAADKPPMMRWDWVPAHSLDEAGRFGIIGHTFKSAGGNETATLMRQAEGVDSAVIGYSRVYDVADGGTPIDSSSYHRSMYAPGAYIDSIMHIDPATTSLITGFNVRAVFFDQDILGVFVSDTGTAGSLGTVTHGDLSKLTLINLRYGDVNVMGNGTYVLDYHINGPALSTGLPAWTLGFALTFKKSLGTSSSTMSKIMNRGGIGELHLRSGTDIAQTNLGVYPVTGYSHLVEIGCVLRDKIPMSPATVTVTVA